MCENSSMLYKNGDIFKGCYKGGVRVGRGLYTFASGEIIEGEWFGDLHAHGIIRYCNGDVYEGEIYKSQKHGLGKYLYSNGDEYRGYWKLENKEGEGQFWTSEGVSYAGYWHKNEFCSKRPLTFNSEAYESSPSYRTPVKGNNKRMKYFPASK